MSVQTSRNTESLENNEVEPITDLAEHGSPAATGASVSSDTEPRTRHSEEPDKSQPTAEASCAEKAPCQTTGVTDDSKIEQPELADSQQHENTFVHPNQASKQTNASAELRPPTSQSGNLQLKVSDDFATIDILPLVSEVSDALLGSGDFFPTVVDTGPEEPGNEYRIGRRSSSLMCLDVLGQCQVSGESVMDLEQYFSADASDTSAALGSAPAQPSVIAGNFLTPHVPAVHLGQEVAMTGELPQVEGIYQQVLINNHHHHHHHHAQQQVAPLFSHTDCHPAMHQQQQQYSSQSQQLQYVRQECHMEHPGDGVHMSASKDTCNQANHVAIRQTNQHVGYQQLTPETFQLPATVKQHQQHQLVHPHHPTSTSSHPLQVSAQTNQPQSITHKICHQNDTQQQMNTMYASVYEDTRHVAQPTQLTHYQTFPLHHNQQQQYQPYDHQPQYQPLQAYENSCPATNSFIQESYQRHEDNRQVCSVAKHELVEIAQVNQQNFTYVPVTNGNNHYYRSFCDSTNVVFEQQYIQQQQHYTTIGGEGYAPDEDNEQAKTYLLLSKTTREEQHHHQFQPVADTSCYTAEIPKYPKGIPQSYDPTVELSGIPLDDEESSDVASVSLSRTKAALKTTRSTKLNWQCSSSSPVCAPETIEKLKALLRSRQKAKETALYTEDEDSDAGDEGADEEQDDVEEEVEEEEDDDEEEEEGDKNNLMKEKQSSGFARLRSTSTTCMHQHLSQLNGHENPREYSRSTNIDQASYRVLQRNKRRHINNVDSNFSSSLSSPSSLNDSSTTDDTQPVQELSSSSFNDIASERGGTINNKQLRNRTIIIKEPNCDVDSLDEPEKLHQTTTRERSSQHTRSSKRKHYMDQSRAACL